MLFDKNGFYMLDDGYDFAIDIINGNIPKQNKSSEMYTLKEALEKGNLYPKIYKGYKNYKPATIKVKNEREKCLLEIQELDFSLNELNLYLDLFPNDKYAYSIFKKYTEEMKRKCENYSKIYGPLLLSDLTQDYEWSMGVWPWEEGRM